MKTTMLKATALLLALGALAGPSAANAQEANEKTRRVYLMGSSLTDQVNYRGLEALAESRGYNHIWGRHMVPGAPIRWLWGHRKSGNAKAPFGTSGKALAEFEWDALTLEPRNGYDSELKAASELIGFAVQKSPDLQVYIFAQWPRIGRGSFDRQWLAPVKDIQNNIRLGFESFLTDVREAHPDLKPPRMIPVGHAMHLLQLKIEAGLVPGMDSVFDGYSDRSHQNHLGEYIVGCTFFATLYGESPVGLPTEPYGPIAPDLARAIQQTVWEAVNAHPRSGVKAPGDLKIITPYLPPAVQASPYRRELHAAFGQSPYRYALADGALPPGLEVDPQGRIIGEATETGDYRFTLQVTDAAGVTARRELRLRAVAESEPVISDQALPAMQRGRFVRYPIKVRDGNGEITWRCVGSWRKTDGTGDDAWQARKHAKRFLMPPGLELTPDGTIVGSPGVAGTYRLRLRAEDADPVEPDADEREFVVEIGPADPAVMLVPPAEGNCRIDGNLDEPFWDLDEPIAKRVVGRPDCKAAFAIVWSRSDLYIAVRVEDDRVVTDSDEPWNDDSVEIFLDGRNDRQTEYNADDKRLVVSAAGKVHQVGLDDPRNFETAVRQTDDGYLVEVQVRMNSIGSRNRPNDAYGFDVAVNDDHAGGPRDGQLVWRGSARNPTDPSQFGTILLTAPDTQN